MRKYLISTAAFVLLAAPSAWSDPPSDRGNKGNEGHAQAEPSRQGPGGGHFDRGDHGPAPQAMQAPPNRGGQNRGFDRGDRDRAPQAAIQAPPNRGDQNRDIDRGDRGRAPQMAVQAPPNRSDLNRGIGRGGDDRSNFNDNRPNRDVNRDANRGGRTDFNRDGRTDFRPDYRRGANYGGPRHDFSGFRDYHRSFHVSRRFYAPAYRRPAGWYEHRWSFGEFLPPAFWVRDYWLIDFAVYDLPPPPYGAVWVRVGPDALLIDEDTGEIITVAYDVFY